MPSPDARPQHGSAAGPGTEALAALPGMLTPAPADAAFSLTVRNDVSELRRMSAWLAQSARDCGLPPERVFELDLCANEALANIISYAYEQAGSHEISLRLCAGGGGASLEIEDDGQPFNPLDAALAPPPASLAGAAIGGLGLKLIRGMAGKCAYQRRGGKNVLTITARA